MERMVVARLEWYVESKDLLSHTQCGFRASRSAYDQIMCLENKIYQGFAENKNTLVVFLDLEGAFDRVWNMALMYKLQEMGITGRMLGWIYAYLSDRKFKVYFEGEYSVERSVKSGVPQGSTISPLLFNVLVKDIFKNDNVCYSEYADDIAIYGSSNNCNYLVAEVQQAVNQFVTWARKWGQSISVSKTKAMHFNKNGAHVNPIMIANVQVEYVSSFKFLGVTFDGPRLNWKTHIETTRNKCLISMHIMKSISNYKWGADRKTLLKLYTALIRSRLDYCCFVYAKANKANLRILDVIQNQCLRLALGARWTSPIVSLEVEAHIAPLSIRRKYLAVKYYYRIMEYSRTHPVVQLIQREPSQINPKSALGAIYTALRDFNLPIVSYRASQPVSCFPPWNDYLKRNLETDLQGYCKHMLNAEVISIHREMIDTTYNNYLSFYTDGSKNNDGVGAAFVCVHSGVTKCYKLHPRASIAMAEIFAIYQTLLYLKENIHIYNNTNIVIMTDSMTSLNVIKNNQTKSMKEYCYEVHQLLFELKSLINIRIQLIPLHKGIRGNEVADAAAKFAVCYGTKYVNFDTINLS